jgi:hypothetical protein
LFDETIRVVGDLLTVSGTAAFSFVVKQQRADPALIFILDTQAARSNSQQGKGSFHPPHSPNWLMGPYSLIYGGESNENRKTEIKIRNIMPLSYKLADMLTML